MTTLEPNPLVTALNDATCKLYDHCGVPHAARFDSLLDESTQPWHVRISDNRTDLYLSHRLTVTGGPWRGDSLTIVEVDIGDDEPSHEHWVLDNRLERK